MADRSALLIRCSPEYLDWARGLAERAGVTLAELVNSGLTLRAYQLGHAPPPWRAAPRGGARPRPARPKKAKEGA